MMINIIQYGLSDSITYVCLHYNNIILIFISILISIQPMQSATSRLNNIVMFGATVLLLFALINHIHGRYFLYDPQPDIKLTNIEVTQFRDVKLWDQLAFRYNLQANLSSLYTWNLKQLYVYIEVTWINQDGLSNRMVASDWIIESPQDRSKIGQKFYIQVKNKPIEYNVRDVYNKLRGQVVNITLNAEYMPTVGFFSKTQLYRTSLKLPDNYTI